MGKGIRGATLLLALLALPAGLSTPVSGPTPVLASAPGAATATAPSPSPSSAPVLPSGAEIVKKVWRTHPRLLARQQDLSDVRGRLATDTTLQSWYAKQRERAQAMLTQELPVRVIPDGVRLLDTSRRVLGDIQTLAVVHELSGDDRYARRAVQELVAVSQPGWGDWNPSHFLDTAEMTRAVGFGYDWLHWDMTKEQRATVRAAIVDKGLKPGHQEYERNAGWTRTTENWSHVCNGGLGIGALAIADEEPVVAGQILEKATRSLSTSGALTAFAPDGAFREGPSYWQYASDYLVAFLASLETAVGTDFGLGDAAGLAQAGNMPLFMTGPGGRAFNYGDAGEAWWGKGTDTMSWMARRYDKPDYAALRRGVGAATPLDLIWYRPGSSSVSDQPLDFHFRGVEVMTLREAWDDPSATWLAFKGGDGPSGHQHLDLGSFVMEANGVRWAYDPGIPNYAVEGQTYFSAKRFDYYRARTEGQNALVINPDAGGGQVPTATAAITERVAGQGTSSALVDLTAAYAGDATKVTRRFALRDGRQTVAVTDRIEAATPADVLWFMHTKAAIALNGSSAILSQDGHRLEVRIVSPAGAKFEVTSTKPLPTSPNPQPQTTTAGNRLTVKLNDVTATNLEIVLTPLS